MRKFKIQNNIIELQILIILILMVISIGLMSYFYLILKTSVIFSHFFYIPISLSCFWWKYKGMLIPITLSGLLLFFPLLSIFSIEFLDYIENIFRVLLLIAIGLIIASLSEAILKREKELKNSKFKLQERLKEINCLYQIIKTINDPSITVDEIFREVIKNIQEALQFPELSCVKLIFGDKEYSTNNYLQTSWKISKKIHVKNKKLEIIACYFEKKPFLNEEFILLNEILKQLKAIFEFKLAWL